MYIGDLLPADRVVVPLPGKTLHDAAEQLVAAFVETGLANDGPKLVARIGSTPPRDAVNVGDRAFILALRTDDAPAVGAALGVTAEPIALGPDVEATASVVVLLIGPYSDASTFIQAIGTFDRALSRADIIDPVSRAKTAADVMAVGDLFEVELPGHLTVADLMARRPRSVWPDATLGEAARVMIANRLAAIPVTSEQGAVVGLLTHRAILKAVLPRYLKNLTSRDSGEVDGRGADDPRDLTVRDVMDKSVLCLSEDQTLADVSNVLTGKEVDRFPVVRDGALVGVLTRRDIVGRLFGS